MDNDPKIQSAPKGGGIATLATAMREGWLGDNYLTFFDGPESAATVRHYALETYLPGYSLVGLHGWDDFIVKSPANRLFSIPTLPIDTKHLAPFTISPESAQLQPDSRFTGLVKWYATPILFGGDPLDKANITWVTFERHAQLVKWWNDRYQEMMRTR